jgi:uridine phosphorylase
VHHAPDLDDLSRRVQLVEDRTGIGLEIAFIVLEELRRAGATAILRVTINDIEVNATKLARSSFAAIVCGARIAA